MALTMLKGWAFRKGTTAYTIQRRYLALATGDTQIKPGMTIPAPPGCTVALPYLAHDPEVDSRAVPTRLIYTVAATAHLTEAEAYK